MKATVRLINHGKVTIPAQLRDELDLDDGDLVELDLQPVTEGDT